MNLKVKANQSFKWSLLIQGSNMVIGFLISIILTRLLLPRDFGLIGMIIIFIAIGRVIMDGGLASSLIRSKILEESDYSTVFFTNLVFALCFYVLLFLSAPLIGDFFDQVELVGLVRLYGLSIIISSLSTIQSVRLNKTLDFKTQFKLLLPSLLISGLIAIWMAFSGYGVWALVAKELVFASLGTFLLWIYSNWKPKLIFSREKFKFHFGYGSNLLMNGVLQATFNNVYQLVIGKFFLPAQLGLFTRAKSMGELPSGFVFNAVNRVMFPLLALVSNDDKKLKRIYRKIIQTISYITVPILILMAILAKPLFLFLFTEKWIEAVPFFQILIIGMIVSPIQQYLLNICKVKGRSDLVLKLSIVQYFLTSVSLTSIIWFGIDGLLWSYVLVTFLSTIITGFFAGKLIAYSLYDQIIDVYKAFLISLLAGIITYTSYNYLHIIEINLLIILLFNSLIFGSFYLGISHLIKHSVYCSGRTFLLEKLSKFPK